MKRGKNKASSNGVWLRHRKIIMQTRAHGGRNDSHNRSGESETTEGQVRVQRDEGASAQGRCMLVREFTVQVFFSFVLLNIKNAGSRSHSLCVCVCVRPDCRYVIDCAVFFQSPHWPPMQWLVMKGYLATAKAGKDLIVIICVQMPGV